MRRIQRAGELAKENPSEDRFPTDMVQQDSHSVYNAKSPPGGGGGVRAEECRGARSHCSTCPRVSGSFRARELPTASAADASKMGTAFVMPTNDVKMLMPKTAASLQRALRNPNAVVLEAGRGRP